MNDDILPSLLKEVQDKFEVAYGKSDIISSAFVKLKNKRQPMPQQMILLLKLETFWRRLSVYL